MTLYLIGLGLSDPKDITLKGLEIIQRSDRVYLENYSSLLQCTTEDLEKLYGKKIIPAPRDLAESGVNLIVEEARKNEVSFLVVGDPFSATTHIEWIKEARLQKVPFQVVPNASILTAVGITGLQLYKFGRTASLPFPEDIPDIETPYQILRENLLLGLHTLFLLDLKPEQRKFLNIPQALELLEKIEKKKQEGLIQSNLQVVGCARLGSPDFVVKSGTLEKIKRTVFGPPPYCLIIPGKLHFLEEEMMEMWKI